MRTHRHVHIPAGLALVLALALAGCGRAEESGGVVLPQVEGSWAVESLTSEGRTLHAPGSARLTLGATEATGSYGCNGLKAAVVHDGADALTVTPGPRTAMACPDMEFETAFAKLFKGRLTIDRGPDRLTLKTSDGSTIAMSPAPPAADAPFTATEWTVTGLLDGQTASSLPAEAAGKARFTVAPDLAVSGNLGCNRFSARATGEGAHITFGPLTSTRMACAGPVGTVEQALTSLFAASPLTWRIDGQNLTLTAPDGKGLTAKAATSVE
ncbi:META domain-containing protein [Streptomyces sp. NPDC047014]|uniref:META domain-containing protein n=1 Tax=Streptomyces sp. NPDC047014 TaxID=3155736 RepID=UPI0033C8BB99